ncbi:hypothetical protein PMI06_009761 [Burkholderia sp. BT03]|nr:hypothetical protein PMI06_009761 [Burkholderia sp. BT03]
MSQVPSGGPDLDPPALDTLSDGDIFQRTNRLVLRQTLIVNALDGYAVSLPMRYVRAPRNTGAHCGGGLRCTTA